MEVVGSQIVYEGNFIDVKEVYFKTKNGKVGVWETVERKIFGKIVAIFAVTKNREVILEKAFRVPLNSYTIEFPAGLMDIKGEPAEAAIKRELLEETGYWFEGKPQLILEGAF